MPVVVVNIIASLEGNAGIAIGSIIDSSNIGDILLILGGSAVVRPRLLKRNTVLSEWNSV